MPLTVVDDRQLRLTDVDQNVKLKNAENLRLENAAPQVQWRETDQALPLGLWRVSLQDDLLTFERNTAVAGDFSTSEVVLYLQPTVIETRKKVVISGSGTNPSIQFGVDLSGTIPTNALAKKDTFRLKFHTGTAERYIAYQSDFRVRETPSGTLDGVNVTFTLANTPVTGTEQVYLNGLLLDPGASNDYTISAATITFNTAPVSTDKIRVSYTTVDVP